MAIPLRSIFRSWARLGHARWFSGRQAPSILFVTLDGEAVDVALASVVAVKRSFKSQEPFSGSIGSSKGRRDPEQNGGNMCNTPMPMENTLIRSHRIGSHHGMGRRCRGCERYCGMRGSGPERLRHAHQLVAWMSMISRSMCWISLPCTVIRKPLVSRKSRTIRAGVCGDSFLKPSRRKRRNQCSGRLSEEKAAMATPKPNRSGFRS